MQEADETLASWDSKELGSVEDTLKAVVELEAIPRRSCKPEFAHSSTLGCVYSFYVRKEERRRPLDQRLQPHHVNLVAALGAVTVVAIQLEAKQAWRPTEGAVQRAVLVFVELARNEEQEHDHDVELHDGVNLEGGDAVISKGRANDPCWHMYGPRAVAPRPVPAIERHG